VIAIETQCFPTPWSKKLFEKELELENTIYLVVREEGKVVGYVGLQKVLNEGHITNLAVHPKYRRRKIGITLAKKVMQKAKEAGVNHFILEVRASNKEAQNLYEKLGFVIIGWRKGYYQNPVEDAMLMIKVEK
jgi:ribosomal-protein-alanine N-acetyltransferase